MEDMPVSTRSGRAFPREPRTRLELYANAIASISHDSVVVDVAAGHGILSLWARGALPASKIVPLDIDAGLVRELRLRHSLDAIRANAFYLPFRDNTVSLVILEQVIEHVDAWSRDALVRESARILEPGGFMFYGSVIRKRHRLGSLRPKPPDHKAEFGDTEEFLTPLGEDFEVKSLLVVPADLPAAYVTYGVLRRIRRSEYDPQVELALEIGRYSRLLRLLERALPFVKYPGFGLKYVHCVAQKRS